MSNPYQKKRKSRRMAETDRIVQRRKMIIKRIWKEDPFQCYPPSPDGRLRKYNLRCDCKVCKRSKSRYKDKGWTKAKNLLKKGFIC